MFNTEANDLKKLDFCLVLSPRLQLKIKQMQKMINFRHILVLSTHAIILYKPQAYWHNIIYGGPSLITAYSNFNY